MKKQRHIILSILTCVFVMSHLWSQKGLVNKADREFENYDYIDAQQMYLDLVSRGYASAEIYRNLGDSYYFIAEAAQAAQWYEKLVEGYGTDPEAVTPQYYLRYALSLKTLKRYVESDAMMDRFRASQGDDTRSQRFVAHKNYLEEIGAQFGEYEIRRLKFNSENQDFGPAFYNGGIVFSSNRPEGLLDRAKVHKLNGLPFLDLYTGSEPGSLHPTVNKFKGGGVNTKYHESTSVFNSDETVMYFTRNNYIGKKTRKDDDNVVRLRLFKSELKDGSWSTPESLPFNSDDYSVAHPALSPDGKTLYFASDMPGSLGGADLWKVSITDTGYGAPLNLGNKINTEGRESFPFIDKANSLYYATDGLPGLGGLDVYKVDLTSSGEVGAGAPLNLGEPVNSSYDDFSFIIDSESGEGFFASNREGGYGYDDIYGVIDVEPSCHQVVSGSVTDGATGAFIARASVLLLDSDGNEIGKGVTNATGDYTFSEVALDCGSVYRVRAIKEGYDTAEDGITTGDVDGGSNQVDLALQAKVSISKGDDLFEVLNLNPIYFDFDKDNIRYDASLELAKILVVMNQIPSLVLDVRSHTDSRGKDSYNLALSKRRNRSTIAWLIERGIASRRLTGDGYGETRLINNCANGVSCSDYEHQQNRSL